MMMNLFSIFDPSSLNGFNFSWISLSFGFFFMVNSSFLIFSRLILFKQKLLLNLLNEIINVTKNKKTSLMFISFFLFVFFVNLLGLVPYIFTSTSHMSVTLSLSLPVWLSFMLMGWFYNMNHMFTHLLPSGTPGFLMIFMVLIETVSNFMRPLTLSLRLMANMTAGHLMMNLLSSMFYSSSLSIFLLLFVSQMILLVLEIAVAMIQSYVLMILSSLYSSEIL